MADTRNRTLTPFAVAYVLLGGSAIAYSASSAEFTRSVWMVVPFAAVAIWVDHWPHRLADRVLWSNSMAALMAAVVLSSPTTAPFVGAMVLAPTAFSRTEREEFQFTRFVTNVGLLACSGFVVGTVFEWARVGTMGPSVRLAMAVALGDLGGSLSGIAFATPAVWYRYGRSAIAGLSEQYRIMLWRRMPVVFATGLLTSVVAVVGVGWLFIAALQIGVIVFYPVERARFDVQRARLITTMTRALDGRGLVGTHHARIEGLGLRVGRRMALSETRLQQLRYVTLTYSMTELFASELARPLDGPPTGIGSSVPFSRLLFTGLALDDIADTRVQEIADAIARYDALVDPSEGEDRLSHEMAIAELAVAGLSGDVLDALDVVAVSDAGDLTVLRGRLESGYPSGPDRLGR